LALENFKPVYYKTETIALISNYLFNAWGKKIGERLTIKERPVPLLTRGGLKRRKWHKPHSYQKGGETPKDNSTRKNINKSLNLG